MMNPASTRRLSLIGIALLLTHCAVADSPEESVGSGATQPDAAENGANEKSADARGALEGVSGSARVRRTADLAADARAYATRVAANAGIRSPLFDKPVVGVGTDGRSHVRLAQMHDGLKVWGADVVVHADDVEVLGLAGSLATRIDALDMGASLEEARALANAKKAQFGTRPITTFQDSVERVVYVDVAGVSHVAFHASFYNELENGARAGLWNYVYDAKTGERLARWNGIDTLSQASGPGGNPKFTHAWNSELDVEATGARFVMTTPRLRTIDMHHAQSGPGTEISAAVGGFSDAAINDAHGYAEITLNLLSEWMGHDSIDDAGFRIVSRVHYGNSYENAFWNGTQMTYGDGASTFYALSGALDVVAHEIHHGFTTKHSNLAYSGESGGLNEGFSDIAGKTAEFYYKKTGANFDVGGDVFKTKGALRYMCNPTKDGVSIDHASRMTPSLDPHYSSGVPNKFFCLLSKRFSGEGDVTGEATADGVRRAATPIYLANAQYWTSSTTFVQGCQGTVDAARSLGYPDGDVDKIKASWADVGVYCDGATAPPPPCDVTLTTATGTLTSPNHPKNYSDSFTKTWCIEAPKGQQATVTFDAFDTESGYDFVTLADGTGAVLSKTAGTTAPSAATSSRVYVIFKTDSSVTKKGWSASWTSQ